MAVKKAYISLGGNSGNEAGRFSEVLRSIDSWPHVRVTGTSKLYRTEPWGDPAQPWFTYHETELSCRRITPRNLLENMLRLETELGRTRDPKRRFGPRVIDLDLLLFGDIVCNEMNLTLPHPRMTERAFVLVPLLEIAPGLKMPGGNPCFSHHALLRYSVEDYIIYQDHVHFH